MFFSAQSLLLLCTPALVLAQSLEGARTVNADDLYIIEFAEAPVAVYRGENSAFSATSPAVTGARKLNTRSAPVVSYRQHLQTVHRQWLDEFESVLGRELEYKFTYELAMNGAALALQPGEAALLAQLPGILSIQPNMYYQLDTDAGPTYIGANTLWDGSNSSDGLPNKGEGVIIGVLDTGVNMDHPSFSGTPEDGYDFAAANPFGAGNFVGACDGLTFVCNNKLIGAWDFADGISENDGPEDSNGHGSHTASTAAGNTISAPPGGFIVSSSGVVFEAPSISGVAPHAHLITYDVCVGSCSGAAINAAIDQAIEDGVDVLSFSISGGVSPWVDSSELRFLNAMNAGIVVSASAGNTGDSVPNPVSKVNHRGPWLLSVANSSHNRVLNNQVNMTAPTPVSSDAVGLYGLAGQAPAITSDVNADIVYAGDVDAGNFEGCSAWPANTFNGQVALISRGSCAFLDKVNNASAAGAVAVIVFNNASLLPIVMGFDPNLPAPTIPSVMVGSGDGANLVSFIQGAASQPVVQIVGTALYEIIELAGNVLNMSSLRGPNLTFDVTKPDINGPGTNIYAAVRNGDGAHPQYGFKSGTSMSAPHVSGAAALLVAAHPHWSPSEIKSALMMSADPNTMKDDGATPSDPDDVGSGTVDLRKAALAGLVMDETFDNFIAANPATGGDPTTLNIASARDATCVPGCVWMRTLKATLPVATSWTVSTVTDGSFTLMVSPSSFTMADDLIYSDGMENSPMHLGQREVTVTIVASGVPDINTGMAFGRVILTEDTDQAPAAHITVAVNQNLPTGL